VIRSDRTVIDWVSEHLAGAKFQEGATALGLERHGKLVAGVVYENWNGVSCTCHIAITAPLSKDYLRAIFHYPFIFGNLGKIIAPISQSNRKSIRLVTNMGFRKEAQILDASPDGSVELYTLGRDECRFIGEQHGQERRSATGT